MKLQIKLTLYNTLTKVAVIVFSGILIYLSLERISYHHISVRLQNKKREFFRELSSTGLSSVLEQQKFYADYNILKDDYIQVKQIASMPASAIVDTFSTGQRTIEGTTDTYRILRCRFNNKNKTYQLEVGNTLDAVEDLKSTIQGYTLIILGVALTLSLLSDMFFTKYLLSPLYRIIDKKLIRVNDPLNFDYEKVATTTDDFSLLDDSISSLMKKITGMFMLEKQFIANVSHELLTPISIISSRLENMLSHETLSEDAENKIFASLKTLNRLKSIINGLLLISQVENNQFNKNDKVNIAELIAETAEELEDRLEDKEITFQNDLKYASQITGNRALIHTMLFNLFNNAIKYNYKSGTIKVKDRWADGRYSLVISDSGIGMNQQQIDNAFNRFEKFDTGEPESFGLGLAIVKSITIFHGIDITIHSAKDKGTAINLLFKAES
ncbi:sensor histidine kinase [Mucilaginibacter ginkgonis]|uniref:histidine kinase n=1 Tax=Mucilaginibacter ginkgonis TaxID=2682091 RepID=A0A6I4HX30_9SPHI|nr:HAMP domain-containing sensor histidine kinase [Mucilaginibacter ginkgonis]QQL51397.1 HAMP domain-containing histidine kinase [Mucilaginibacter ginkgonis]